jgi:hypothetical protein
MAAVIAYRPADIPEALLAAQIVAADAQAMDCLRSAVAPDADAETTRRCRGQAAAMIRQGRFPMSDHTSSSQYTSA